MAAQSERRVHKQMTPSYSLSFFLLMATVGAPPLGITTTSTTAMDDDDDDVFRFTRPTRGPSDHLHTKQQQASKYWQQILDCGTTRRCQRRERQRQ